MTNTQLVQWLFEQGGPILRHRIALDLMDASPQERAQLRQQALETPEVQRWLANLHQAHSIHGSTDTHAENALAKLLEYGFDRSLPTIGQEVRRILEYPLGQWDALVLFPLLLRAGYVDLPPVMDWFSERIDKLSQTAARGSFDFYLSVDEAARVPKAWRGKPIYRDEYGHQAGYALPTCFDLYALGYSPSLPSIPDLASRSEASIAFLSDQRFQATPGGYGWDRHRNRCYAAGRVFLACVEAVRLVLFLELASCFKAARQSDWFQQGLCVLESSRTPEGTYRFPSGMIQERAGSHIYAGSHMGLGENRAARRGIELESTFRMLYIRKRYNPCGNLGVRNDHQTWPDVAPT